MSIHRRLVARTTADVRLSTPSLRKMMVIRLFKLFSFTRRTLAMLLLDLPRAIWARIAASCEVSGEETGANACFFVSHKAGACTWLISRVGSREALDGAGRRRSRLSRYSPAQTR